MTGFTRTTVGLLFVLIIAFCGVFIFSRVTDRMGGIDLTEDGLYTLSDGSKEILAALDRPLEMHFYYGKEGLERYGYDGVRPYQNYSYYVRDLLRAYERASGGKIKLFEYDPRPFSDEAAQADAYGLQRVPLTEVEGFYFGLAVTSGAGSKEVVPFFSLQMQPQLEYRISELIDTASRRKKTRLAVLSSLEVLGDDLSPYMRQMMQMQNQQPSEPWFAIEQLRRFYKTEKIEADATEIDASVDYLLVIHPKGLSDATLYAIDQFVMRGGKLMVFVDPHCMADAPQGPQAQFGGGDQSSNIDRLLSAWGVEVPTGQFAGDLTFAREVSSPAGPSAPFLGQMSFRDEGLARGEVVTQGLDMVDMVFPGVVRTVEGVDVTVSPLILTTAAGNSWSASPYELNPRSIDDVRRLAAKLEPSDDPVWAAAKVQGTLRSAFPDGAPEPETTDEDEEEPAEVTDRPPHLEVTAEPNAVIVVADVDVLTDGVTARRGFFGYEMVNSNIAFLTNALDHLAGSSALIGIRTRKQFRRPFDVVEEIEREANARTLEQVQEIDAEIQKFNDEIRELDSLRSQENAALVANEQIEKLRKARARVRELERQKRELQQDKLVAIESLGATIKNLNVFGIPALVAAVGLALFFVRSSRRRVQVRGGAA